MQPMVLARAKALDEWAAFPGPRPGTASAQVGARPRARTRGDDG